MKCKIPVWGEFKRLRSNKLEAHTDDIMHTPSKQRIFPTFKEKFLSGCFSKSKDLCSSSVHNLVVCNPEYTETICLLLKCLIKGFYYLCFGSN